MIESTTSANAEDMELARRFIAGDEAAFAALAERYRSRIFRVCLRIVYSHSDAEEITQDTFWRAYRSLRHFRGDCKFSTWLHMIAKRLSVNRYWANRRRCRHLSTPLDAPLGHDTTRTIQDTLRSEEIGPATAGELAEAAAHVEAAMELIPAFHRAILQLWIVEHQTYLQISNTLGIGMGTMKSRMSRARESLRKAIAHVSTNPDRRAAA